MQRHVIRRGWDVPLFAAAGASIEEAVPVASVAVRAVAFRGLRPKLRVTVGERVHAGQVLFADGARPGVLHTAPAAGTVTAIERGARRRLCAVSLAVDADADAEAPPVAGWRPGLVAEDLDDAAVRGLLTGSGLWTMLRSRPLDGTPAVDAVPRAIVVTACDSRPLAPDPALALAGREESLRLGLRLLARLGPVHCCLAEDSPLADCCADLPGVRRHAFVGPHPSGSVGYHIHCLCPVDRGSAVWHIHAEDVAAIGACVNDGRWDRRRVVAVAGPAASRPRLLRTLFGAAIPPVLSEEETKNQAVIAGSVLDGRIIEPGDVAGAHLGPFERQITLLSAAAPRRRLFSWLPFLGTRSLLPRGFLDRLGRRGDPVLGRHGSTRALIPTGAYQRVFPFDILIAPLLRALQAGDDELAEQLGCLELAEEDLALCSLVCPCAIDHGAALRACLERLAGEMTG